MRTYLMHSMGEAFGPFDFAFVIQKLVARHFGAAQGVSVVEDGRVVVNHTSLGALEEFKEVLANIAPDRWSTEGTSEHGPCPLQEGDRIGHKTYGVGRVCSPPSPMFGSEKEGESVRTVPRGWSVEVEWDDPSLARGKFAFHPGHDAFLVKI